jgi:hypothetical protein
MLSFATYFGYLASLLLILALVVNNDLKFRWFNLGGNIAFIIYGMMLHAVPVLITNIILLVLNLYYLWKVYTRKENFDLIEFKGEEKLVDKFLTFHQSDIHSFFPEFDASKMTGNLNFVVLRDLVIANIFSAHINNEGDAEVMINYTLLRYRDFKVGRFIFEKEKDFLTSKGVKRIVYKTVINKNHSAFLKVMGFQKQAAGGKCWAKNL